MGPGITSDKRRLNSIPPEFILNFKRMKHFKTLLLMALCSLFIVPVYAQITVGPMMIGQGVTAPEDWEDYYDRGIYVDVNTSSCGFTSTPHYLVTLESLTNQGYIWRTTGTPAIYNPTPTGFRVYLRWPDHPSVSPTVGVAEEPNPLRALTAIERDWVIRWTGIVTGDCISCDGEEQPIMDNSDVEAEPGSEVMGVKPILEKKVKLSPNPASSLLKIEADEPIQKSELYDMRGNLLMTSYDNSLFIENFPAGNYLVKVYFENLVVSEQFVVMK